MARACDALGELEQRSCWQGYQGCGLQASTKPSTREPHCRTILGVNWKLVTMLARFAGWGRTGAEQSYWRLFSKLGMLCFSCHATVTLCPSKSDPSHSSHISGQGSSGDQANPKPDFCNWAIWEVPYPSLQEVKGNVKQRSSVTWTWWNSGINGMVEGCCWNLYQCSN